MKLHIHGFELHLTTKNSKWEFYKYCFVERFYMTISNPKPEEKGRCGVIFIVIILECFA